MQDAVASPENERLTVVLVHDLHPAYYACACAHMCSVRVCGYVAVHIQMNGVCEFVRARTLVLY